jgi:hypothetical protein
MARVVRTVTIQVGWLALALVLVAVALLVLLVRRPVAPAPAPGIDPARVRVACAQYAGLDLSGWASICADAGYQERAWTTATPGAAWWPRVLRTTGTLTTVVQPEDLDR